MWQFAMAHEFISLIIFLSSLWAVERSIRAIAERNKPACDCLCCLPNDEDASNE